MGGVGYDIAAKNTRMSCVHLGGNDETMTGKQAAVRSVGPEASGKQGEAHLTGPKLKAMKRRKTIMQTTFLFPEPSLSSLF